MNARAVSFDAGQTLVELDTGMLSARLAERGVHLSAAALDAAQPAAWQRYEIAVRGAHEWCQGPAPDRRAGAPTGGAEHEAPWQLFMSTLIDGAGGTDAEALAAWLWSEQPRPRRNLWRRPIAGMFELARDLTAAGVPVVILSNSEGKLAELIDEIGWRAPFRAVIDSGRLGFAKPDPRIFAHTEEVLGVAPGEIVHVGDSRTADIDGARAAGWRAIWFGPAARASSDERVAAAADAGAVRAHLARWGLPTLSSDDACQGRGPVG